MKLHIIATAFHKPLRLERLVRNIQVQTFETVKYNKATGKSVKTRKIIEPRHDPNWTFKAIHDGQPPREMIEFFDSIKDPRIEFDYTKKVNGYWGHPNRGMMLQELKGDDNDYVLITNDDNQYVDTFIEIFLQLCNPTVGMVYCNTVHNYFGYQVLASKIKVGHIDMGSFIVKLDVAKRVGFVHTEEVADGIYAEECAEECVKKNLKIINIPRPLFIHN